MREAEEYDEECVCCRKTDELDILLGRTEPGSGTESKIDGSTNRFPKSRQGDSNSDLPARSRIFDEKDRINAFL